MTSRRPLDPSSSTKSVPTSLCDVITTPLTVCGSVVFQSAAGSAAASVQSHVTEKVDAAAAAGLRLRKPDTAS